MGWWKTDAGYIIGDGVLDLTEDFLREFSQEYNRELERQPTLEELLYCLKQVLRHSAEGQFADMTTVEVEEIVAKKKKRPRKQLLKPGGVFSIPLANGMLAFGRLTPQAGVMEFFDLTSKKVVPVSALSSSGRFTFPFLISTEALEQWDWRVFDELPYRDGEFKIHLFRVAGQVACGTGMRKGFLDSSTSLRPATAEELAEVPEFGIVTTELLRKRLMERLVKNGRQVL